MTPRVQQDREQITVGSVTISRQAARSALGVLSRYQDQTRAQMVCWAAQGFLDESEEIRQVCEGQVSLRDDISTGVQAIIRMLSEAVTEDSLRTH